MTEIKIHPSILAADFSRLADEIDKVSNADAIHVDVMDNHFVPNLTFGHGMVQRLVQVSTTPIDVHLMIENADYEAPRFADFGAGSVTFHIEASSNPRGTLAAIRAAGAKAAVAIRPSTPLDQITGLLGDLDMVLVMTVEPGFGGQQLIPAMLDRVREIRSLTSDLIPNLWIQVDGGVGLENISQLASSGANVFVAGSSIFGHSSPFEAITQLRSKASGMS